MRHLIGALAGLMLAACGGGMPEAGYPGQDAGTGSLTLRPIGASCTADSQCAGYPAAESWCALVNGLDFGCTRLCKTSADCGCHGAPETCDALCMASTGSSSTYGSCAATCSAYRPCGARQRKCEALGSSPIRGCTPG